MRDFQEHVSKGFSIILLAVCLLITGGCAAEKSQNQADTEVSAFSFGGQEGIRNTLEYEESQTDISEAVGSQNLAVQFLDVGQGSAALVHQNDTWMLIDGGDRDYSSYVVSYLKKQGITQLDYVVVSHYDSDHLSGIVGVLNAFSCKQVLAPDYETDTGIYESFLEVIEEKDLTVIYPELGDIYTFADSSFEIVAPAYYGYEESNSNSLGIRLEYGENSFLICGDCTEESEWDLLYQGVDLDSDVFVANHHGSKYSNGEAFMDAVSPESVVISCGAGNSYGHPDASVLLEVQKQGAELYRTDLQGTITAVSDGETIAFQNEVCMDYRSGAEVEKNQKTGGQLDESQEDDMQDGNLQLGDAESNELPATGSEDIEVKYILNTNSRKFHLPDCSSAEDMEDKNKAYSKDSREELIKEGYSPCKRCNP